MAKKELKGRYDQVQQPVGRDPISGACLKFPVPDSNAFTLCDQVAPGGWSRVADPGFRYVGEFAAGLSQLRFE